MTKLAGVALAAAMMACGWTADAYAAQIYNLSSSNPIGDIGRISFDATFSSSDLTHASVDFTIAKTGGPKDCDDCFIYTGNFHDINAKLSIGDDGFPSSYRILHFTSDTNFNLAYSNVAINPYNGNPNAPGIVAPDSIDYPGYDLEIDIRKEIYSPDGINVTVSYAITTGFSGNFAPIDASEVASLFSPISPVPLPSSILLFGGAILGLGAAGFGARCQSRKREIRT